MQKSYFGSITPVSSNAVGSANVAGTRFQNISNPYANLPRTQTPWDRLVNWFGFRSGYDKAQEQYNLAGAEYNAQLEQLASEEAYNSPSQQAARMRQAGLNPDLTGVSGEPASEFDNQQQSPDINAGIDLNPLDLIKTIGSGFMNTFTGVIGLLQDINLLHQSKIATDEKDLDYLDKMIKVFQTSNPLFEVPSSDGSVTSVNLKEKNPTIFHSSGMTKRFNKFRQSAFDSLLGLTSHYNSYDDFAKSAQSLGTSMSMPWFNGFAGLSAKDVADFLKPLSRAQLDLMFAQTKAENSKAYKEFNQNAYEGDAYAKLQADPAASSALAGSIKSGNEADIAENAARSSIAPLTVTKNKIIGRMISSIDRIPDRNLGTTILKFFLINQLSSGMNPLGTVSKVATSLLK